MQFAAKLRREYNAVDQISPKPIFLIEKLKQKEVGGRGGAFKFMYIYIYIYVYRHGYTALHIDCVSIACRLWLATKTRHCS